MTVKRFSDAISRIWLVAKGPSCLKIHEYLRDTDKVASVNDGAMHIPEKEIEYVFFSDLVAMDLVKDHESRVKRFVSRMPLELEVDDHPEWMVDRWSFYPERECGGDRSSIAERIISGGVCHHHTTPAAIHYLCKYETYDEICVIGADGGSKYADGKSPTRVPSVNLDEWSTISRRVGDICSNVYGKRVRFYS